MGNRRIDVDAYGREPELFNFSPDNYNEDSSSPRLKRNEALHTIIDAGTTRKAKINEQVKLPVPLYSLGSK